MLREVLQPAQVKAQCPKSGTTCTWRKYNSTFILRDLSWFHEIILAPFSICSSDAYFQFFFSVTYFGNLPTVYFRARNTALLSLRVQEKGESAPGTSTDTTNLWITSYVLVPLLGTGGAASYQILSCPCDFVLQNVEKKSHVDNKAMQS